MSGLNLPKNAHVSTHPCLQAKLSQLRSASTGSKDAQTLVHELALMVGYEALAAGLKTQQAGTVRTSIPSHLHSPSHIMSQSGVVVRDTYP
jgi:uracil phosphoribosyltransferase